MNREKVSKATADRLPKSVKVRSTCNACQQAKIRCSHEKPSCRRCQKHNVECIYSMSRRLGRPAKRRESQYASLPTVTRQNDHHRQQRDKKISAPKAGKSKQDQAQDRTDEDDFLQSLEETVAYDPLAVNDTPLDDISLEGSSLRTPNFGDNDQLPSFAVSDPIDFSSDSWLQEFLSQQVPDLAQERSLLDTLAFETSKTDKEFSGVSTELSDLIASPKDLPISSPKTHNQPPPVTYHSAEDFYVTAEALMTTSQSLSAGQSLYPEALKKVIPGFTQHISTTESFSDRLMTVADPSALLAHQKVSKLVNDYGLPPDSISINLGALDAATTRQCQCQCHEHIIRELIRANVCASRTGPSATIDSILNCQRILQHLAETILQCTVCSKTRVNLLMVVVVGIDSLITTLEVITSGDGGVMQRVLPEFHDHLFLRRDYGQEFSIDGSHRRYRSGIFQFRAEVESRPLMVGSFPVPVEEKCSFVHQVLYARLNGLLSVIRRIRHCTQQILAVSASRGRLSMMMETDRRLQIFLMRIRMFVRS